MTRISPKDKWKFDKVEGYLSLKMLARAREALNQLQPDYATNTLYLLLDQGLAAEEQDWARATEIGLDVMMRLPDESGTHIQYAYALRRSASISEARNVLLNAYKKFPNEATIPYNLACYACVEGNLVEAINLLRAAASLSANCIQMALDDEDLEPLWPEIHEWINKRSADFAD